MTKKSFFRSLLIATMMCAPLITTSAQVTIGSANRPSQFSLLDLDATNIARRLHNARLTAIQRDALVNPSSSPEDKDLAQGLLLYNTDNDCLEFWNGNRWVSLCEGTHPADPSVPPGYTGIWNWKDLAEIANDLTGNYILMTNLDKNSGYWMTEEGGFTGMTTPGLGGSEDGS